MALSDAERQARRRGKLKAKGEVLFQAWVTPAQSKQIKALLAGAGVTYHTPPAPLRRKRRRPFDPVFWENRRIVEAHRLDIRARLAAGEKPSRIAAWLNTHGFLGTGETLNRLRKDPTVVL